MKNLILILLFCATSVFAQNKTWSWNISLSDIADDTIVCRKSYTGIGFGSGWGIEFNADSVTGSTLKVEIGGRNFSTGFTAFVHDSLPYVFDNVTDTTNAGAEIKRALFSAENFLFNEFCIKIIPDTTTGNFYFKSFQK